MTHPYKDILIAIAEGEEIEFRHPGSSRFIVWPAGPILSSIADGCYDPECYRVKHKTININGFHVPEPVREPLKVGDEYWVADFFSLDPSRCYEWADDQCDHAWLHAGLIHLSQEAAGTHAKALLSFTKREAE